MVIFVTAATPAGRKLAQAFAPHVDRVLIETSPIPLSFYRWKLKQSGIADFIFQAWLKLYYHRRLNKLLGYPGLPEHQICKSINKYKFNEDDIVICFGTGIVKKKTIKSVKHIFNIHTGILPRYRGVKSEFWAMREGGKNGWTIHHLIRKLDAGAIVMQNRVIVKDCKCPIEMRMWIITDLARTANLICSTLTLEYLCGVPQDEEHAKYYTTPTLKQWMMQC